MCWGTLLLVIHQALSGTRGPWAFRVHSPSHSEPLPSAWPPQVALGAGSHLGAKAKARDVRERRDIGR